MGRTARGALDWRKRTTQQEKEAAVLRKWMQESLESLAHECTAPIPAEDKHLLDQSSHLYHVVHSTLAAKIGRTNPAQGQLLTDLWRRFDSAPSALSTLTAEESSAWSGHLTTLDHGSLALLTRIIRRLANRSQASAVLSTTRLQEREMARLTEELHNAERGNKENTVAMSARLKQLEAEQRQTVTVRRWLPRSVHRGQWGWSPRHE
jgi:hypothetical protein